MTPSVPIEIIRDISARLKEATRLLDKAVEREMGREREHKLSKDCWCNPKVEKP